MRVDIQFKGLEEQIRKLDQLKDKEFNATIQKAFTRYMDLVKYMSHKEIIRRTVPGMITTQSGQTRKPTGRELYEMQPTTPGKLTSRTGRTVAGLLEGKNHIGKSTSWVGAGKKGQKMGIGGANIKTNTSVHKTLNGRMHTSATGMSAWWSVYVRAGSMALIGVKGQDSDQKKRVAFRYMWENGLRGGAPRQYLHPAHQRLQGQFIPLVEQGLNNMIREVGMR